VSLYLARLRKDGLVSTRRESQTIYYSIDNEVAVKLIGLLHGAFCG